MKKIIVKKWFRVDAPTLGGSETFLFKKEYGKQKQ